MRWWRTDVGLVGRSTGINVHTYWRGFIGALKQETKLTPPRNAALVRALIHLLVYVVQYCKV